MRNLLVFEWVVSLLVTACGGTSVGTSATPDASTDAETCTGTQPAICNGCCGSKYAADQCLNGSWTCRPLGGACAICDAGNDATATDAATCTGTPPVVCNGCCGSKYAADQCLDGAWTCRPLGVACVICDAGSDHGLDDAVAGGCGLAGEACCPPGDPGMVAIAPCNLGLSCCPATNACSAECVDAGRDAGTSSGPCGARDDAGVAHSGTCLTGQFCCDQSHTGATSFVCRDAGVPCVPVP